MILFFILSNVLCVFLGRLIATYEYKKLIENTARNQKEIEKMCTDIGKNLSDFFDWQDEINLKIPIESDREDYIKKRQKIDKFINMLFK